MFFEDVPLSKVNGLTGIYNTILILLILTLNDVLTRSTQIAIRHTVGMASSHFRRCMASARIAMVASPQGTIRRRQEFSQSTHISWDESPVRSGGTAGHDQGYKRAREGHGLRHQLSAMLQGHRPPTYRDLQHGVDHPGFLRSSSHGLFRYQTLSQVMCCC